MFIIIDKESIHYNDSTYKLHTANFNLINIVLKLTSVSKSQGVYG